EVVAFRQLLAEQNSNSNKIDQSQAQLLKQKSKLEQQQRQLQSSTDKRRLALAKIDLQISRNRTKIKKLAADKKRLEKVISGIEKILAKAVVKVQVKAKVQDNRPFKVLKGKLPWPVKGKVIRKFASVENKIAYDGVLISAVAGRSVQAVHSGMVVFADWLRSYGMLMIIDHGDGYMTLYGHNQQLLKSVGDSVSNLEPIAMTGNSGGNLNSGLYFAIRHNGQTTNPRTWFARR
ncbi:MAG: peptidoglycan DD-metalloendopeptidase family protein, partial [Pseudomonadales bacterium]|nr:peptidoglycan DD-metalloendopeptidase family protein [Pseudomonadales bacterium]